MKTFKRTWRFGLVAMVVAFIAALALAAQLQASTPLFWMILLLFWAVAIFSWVFHGSASNAKLNYQPKFDWQWEIDREPVHIKALQRDASYQRKMNMLPRHFDRIRRNFMANRDGEPSEYEVLYGDRFHWTWVLRLAWRPLAIAAALVMLAVVLPIAAYYVGSDAGVHWWVFIALLPVPLTWVMVAGVPWYCTYFVCTNASVMKVSVPSPFLMASNVMQAELARLPYDSIKTADASSGGFWEGFLQFGSIGFDTAVQEGDTPFRHLSPISNPDIPKSIIMSMVNDSRWRSMDGKSFELPEGKWRVANADNRTDPSAQDTQPIPVVDATTKSE